DRWGPRPCRRVRNDGYPGRRSDFDVPVQHDRQNRPANHRRAQSDWRPPMTGKRFIMNAGRTTKQGQQINVGKDHAEYQALVSTLIMHPDDMKEAGIVSGGTVRVVSDNGEA